MNLGTLNTIIALVVVLLVLSLMVQSIQTAIKKILNLKSRQIAESLKDLFDQAISPGQPGAASPPVGTPAAGTPVAGTPAASQSLPSAARNPLAGFINRLLATILPLDARSKGLWVAFKAILFGVERPRSIAAEDFKTDVFKEFNEIGRVTRWGNTALDSLSKEDLLKVIAKLDLERFLPDSATKLAELWEQVNALRTEVGRLAQLQQIAAGASAKISELRAILTPLITDVEAFLDPAKSVQPRVVFGDLLRLTKLEVSSVLKLVTEAQKAVDDEMKKLQSSSPPTPPDQLEDLKKISQALSRIAKLIGDLSQKFDQVVAPLRAKLTQIETWFDTVTQSFDQRYTRHMRTVSICISIVIVVLLNANFFKVYRSISTNEVQKDLIVEAGRPLLEKTKQAEDAARANEPQPEPTPTPTPNQNSGQSTATTTSSPSTTPTPPSEGTVAATPTPTPTPFNAKKEFERTKENVELYVNTYEQFGFSPLSGEQFEAFLWSTGVPSLIVPCDGKGRTLRGCTVRRNEKGVPVNKSNVPIKADCREKDADDNRMMENGVAVDCTPAWRSQSAGEWWASRKHDFTVLFGWAVMVVLLSVGAPFWQDTLESLFGIKNLLRQKSSTQNVEKESGTGQPRS